MSSARLPFIFLLLRDVINKIWKRPLYLRISIAQASAIMTLSAVNINISIFPHSVSFDMV